VAALTELLQAAQKKPLGKEEIDLVLPHLKTDVRLLRFDGR
jgi:hypothetical protein